MFPSAKVLAIDDIQGDLDRIRTGLHEAGIACMPILYSPGTAPAEPYQGVRIVFMDLNLIGGHRDDAELADIAAQTLKCFIARGPYLLIFWSGLAGNVDEVVKQLRQRHADTPAPLAIGVMNKSDLVLPEKTADNYGAQLDALKQSILREVAKSPQLLALLHWEAKLAQAAAGAFGELHSLAAGDACWDFPAVGEHLGNILGKVAVEAAGVRAETDKAAAIEQGLAPLLNDFMEQAHMEETVKQAWEAALPSQRLREVDLPAHVPPSKLNARYLFDLRAPEKTHRGAVVAIGEGTDCQAVFGLNSVSLAPEFLDLGRVAERGQRRAILSACHFCLTEFSAACDQAQGKVKLFRYALCLMIPGEHRALTFFERTSAAGTRRDPTNHAAIYRFPDVNWQGRDWILKANLRYVISLPANSPVLGSPMFRVRAQALACLAHHFGQHSTRPGMLEFH